MIEQSNAGILESIAEEFSGNDEGNDEGIRTKNFPRKFTKQSLYNHNDGLLHLANMHNATPESLMCIGNPSSNNAIEVIRPKQKKLGQYFRKGFRPFVDHEEGRYFLTHPDKPTILEYIPETRQFAEVDLRNW